MRIIAALTEPDSIRSYLDGRRPGARPPRSHLLDRPCSPSGNASKTTRECEKPNLSVRQLDVFAEDETVD